MEHSPLWRQFRRLLLGSVVEALLPNGVDLDLRTLDIRFEDDSVFKVPRLDNYMRFRGSVRGKLRSPLDDASRARLLTSLRTVWPELVAVMDIPVGDSLTVDDHQVSVDVTGGELLIRFDLSAD